jgi:hypothetical protein
VTLGANTLSSIENKMEALSVVVNPDDWFVSPSIFLGWHCWLHSQIRISIDYRSMTVVNGEITLQCIET